MMRGQSLFSNGCLQDGRYSSARCWGVEVAWLTMSRLDAGRGY